MSLILYKTCQIAACVSSTGFTNLLKNTSRTGVKNLRVWTRVRVRVRVLVRVTNSMKFSQLPVNDREQEQKRRYET